MLATGEWQLALEFCQRNPAILQHLLVLSLASAFGQIFVSARHSSALTPGSKPEISSVCLSRHKSRAHAPQRP